MLLRASSELAGESVDVGAVTAGDAADAGVEAGQWLVAFAEAATRESPWLPEARAALLEQLGPEALVDAAGVVGNFERMVRIADGAGIELDTSMALASEPLRRELGIDDFASATNTPPLGTLARTLGAVGRNVAFGTLRLLGRRS